MRDKIFNLIISFIITVCAFCSVYSEATDYEYTNSLSDIMTAEDLTDISDVPPILLPSADSGSSENVPVSIQEITSVQSPQEVLEAVNEAEETGNTAEVEFQNFNIVASYEYMKRVNNDTIGWLNIPNIGSYPVMFSNDNSFYLTHSATGAQFENGAIFMNAYNNGKFDDICLIHGHHLKSGGMFGSLKKYKDKWFFNNNDLIEVYDGQLLRYYRPFSVYYYEDGNEYIPAEFYQDSDKINYFQATLDRSMVKSDKQYTIRADSDIMILSTCDYEFENCRLAIACYEVLSLEYSDN